MKAKPRKGRNINKSLDALESAFDLLEKVLEARGFPQEIAEDMVAPLKRQLEIIRLSINATEATNQALTELPIDFHLEVPKAE